MKIGVVSDTHLNEPHAGFKRMIESHFKDVDRIVHAGDFVDWTVAEYLSGLKELVAVCGNMDSHPLRKAFPRKRVVEIEGLKIGLIHGGGAPLGIEERIRAEFDGVDAIVYGHTHTPVCHEVKGVCFFNPGSPTRPSVGRPTLGILKVGERIEGEIIPL